MIWLQITLSFYLMVFKNDSDLVEGMAPLPDRIAFRFDYTGKGDPQFS
jgi:hypothetical protein